MIVRFSCRNRNCDYKPFILKRINREVQKIQVQKLPSNVIVGPLIERVDNRDDYNDLHDMYDEMEDLQDQNGRIIIENQKHKREIKHFDALEVAFMHSNTIRQWKTIQNFVFVATEAVQKVDEIMDKVFIR